MSHLYAKVTLLVFGIFAVVLLLIRAQPYDDHELRALLMPENCAMPCFMSIRPGVTTADEAVAILRASDWVEWVGDVQPDAYSQHPFYVFQWSGQQPDFIDGSDRGIIRIWPDAESGQGDLVGSFGFELKTPFLVGEIYTIWGKPARMHFGRTGFNTKGNIISMETIHEYPASFLEFTAFSSCPASYNTFLNSSVHKITYTIWPSQKNDTLYMMKYLLYTQHCG